MNKLLIIASLCVGLLLCLVLLFEFYLGLQHYQSFDKGDPLARVSFQPSCMQLRALPKLHAPNPLEIAAEPKGTILLFDCLKAGSFGTILGLDDRAKLSLIDYVDPAGKRVKQPINGGRDLCYQFLELCGGLGEFIAKPFQLKWKFKALGKEDGTKTIVYDGMKLIGK